MRTLLRDIFLKLSSVYAIPYPGVHILSSHFAYPTVKLDRLHFARFLDYLQSIGQIIDFSAAVDRITNHNFDTNIPLFALSFDDGFLDCYDSIYSELKMRDIEACFFINSTLHSYDNKSKADVIKNIDHKNKTFMSWEMIDEISSGGQLIGSHGCNHLRLADQDWVQFLADVLSNEEIIFKNIGKKVDYFAWPYGRNIDVTENQVNYLRSRYKCVFSGDSFRSYFSYSGKVINRRHVEPYWPSSHIKYFVSHEKKIFNSN